MTNETFTEDTEENLKKTGRCRYCGESLENCTCDKTGTWGHVVNHDLGSD
jgi:hypothetical protein